MAIGARAPTWPHAELAHLREMQAQQRECQNTADHRQDPTQGIPGEHSRIIGQVEATLHEGSELQKEQARSLLVLTNKVEVLCAGPGATAPTWERQELTAGVNPSPG
jgi:hypothetical protein